MSTEHILMALAAGGLTPSEKLLLIAYADHTDAHGYCWPSVQRLADITGLSRATVTRTNAALRKKGLIRSVRRVNPRTGLPISNLTRLNVRLLASMRRPVEKLDNLVEEITFDGDETPSDLQKAQPEQQADASGTPSDLLIAHHEPYIGLTMSPRQAHHEPQTSHGTSHGTSSPYPLADVQESHTHRPQEEEEATPEKGTPPGEPTAAGEAAALIAELPTIATRAGRPLRRHLLPSETTRLAQAITAALARGWTPDQIRAALSHDLDSARSVVATWSHRLRDLGDPPPATPAQDATAAQREAQARARAERAEMEARRARDVAAHAARARAILAAACKSA